MKDVYSIVTDRIIDLLGKGVVPWHQPWKGGDGAPANLVSKKPYRGVNVFLLNSVAYLSPYWLTFKQARSLGGNIRKGEKGSEARSSDARPPALAGGRLWSQILPGDTWKI